MYDSMKGCAEPAGHMTAGRSTASCLRKRQACIIGGVTSSEVPETARTRNNCYILVCTTASLKGQWCLVSVRRLLVISLISLSVYVQRKKRIRSSLSKKRRNILKILPSTMKKGTKLPRFSKKKSAKQSTQLVTQYDFYSAGFQFEDQANRWLISDIKKTLKFYQQAMIMYQTGLTAPDSKVSMTYDIHYNITRLYLQIYNDYLASHGFINILQYVDLSDMADIDKLFKPLQEIVSDMETVLQTYSNVPNLDTWDLQSNLIIAYLNNLESQDQLALTGSELLNLNDKFHEISITLLLHQINELISDSDMVSLQDNDTTDDGFAKDIINEQIPNKNGMGIKTDHNIGNHSQDIQDELVNVSDQITFESASELIFNMLKFEQNMLELVIENRLNEKELNPVQLNHLEDHIDTSLNQINDIINTHSILAPLLTNEEFQIITYTINCDKLILNQQFDILQENIANNGGSINFELANIDLLKFAQNCIQSSDLELCWKISTLLSKKLTEVRNSFSAQRQNLLKSLDKEALSGTVYQLCNLYLESAENETLRYRINKEQDPANTKTQEVLLKNINILLNNGATIAKAHCGMQEHVNDKLVRNYIFNELNQAILNQNDPFPNK